MVSKLVQVTNRNDDENILLFQKGDKIAFGKLYDQFAPILFSVILHIVENRKNAEAALTKTFLQIWENRKSYCREREYLIIWLMRFAREAAFSLKGNKAIIILPDFIEKQEGDDCTQRLLDMLFIFGKTPQEICLLLNIPHDVLTAKLNQIFKTAIQKSKCIK